MTGVRAYHGVSLRWFTNVRWVGVGLGTVIHRVWRLGLAVLLAVPIAALEVPLTAAAADAPPTVTNYPAPYSISWACDITTGPDGALWFTNFRGNSIGRMSTDGTLTTYTGTGVSAPCAITTGPDGALWFMNNGNNSVGRITTGGIVTNYNGGGTGIRNYLNENPGAITTGPDGALWFTNGSNDSIGRITTAGTITNYTGTGISTPRAITVGSDGALWFVNFGSIGRITTAGAVTNYTAAGILVPRAIASGPDGALWFTNGGDHGSIGRITTAGTVTIYPDPSISGAYDITVGPDGALWFTNLSSDSIGRITMAGVVSHYTTNNISAPVGIASGPDGALWFTGYDAIWRMTTAGTFNRYRAPGTQGPFGITAGPDGALWFTNQGNDSIGRIDPAGTVTNYTGVGIAFPGSITAGPDGALWFTNNGNENNGEHDSIGRITTAGTVTNYPDPSISAPQGITSGPDGALWFTNRDNNSIGRITTAGIVTSYTAPSISNPQGIASGPDGALWFANSGNNSIGRITAGGTVGNYTSVFIANPVGITAGPDGNLWFTNNGYSANWVGRMTTAGTVTRVNAVIGSAITPGPDSTLWVTDPADDLVARITTNGEFKSYFDASIDGPYGIVAGPDGAMWFTNSANNSIGRITVPTTTTTVPGSPTNVSASRGNASASVSFTAPADDGGSPITGFGAVCKSSDGGETGIGSATSTPVIVSGLTNGHLYSCTVTATNIVGTGLASGTSQAFVPATVPDPPTNLSATAGNASASVSFTAPLNDGGSPITQYTVVSSPGGMSASSAHSPIVVSGLTNGVSYTFTATAANNVGTGAQSPPSSTVIPDDGPPIAAMSTPNSPVHLSTSVPESWFGSDASGLAHFDVRRAIAPWNGSMNSWGGWLSGTHATSATYAGTYGRTYCFDVRAQDNVGNLSAWSTSRCTAVPLRSDQLSYSAGWSKSTSPVYFAGFDYRSKTHAAKATRTGIIAKRLYLVATECASCGTAQVRWNGAVIASIDTYHATTIHKHVIHIVSWPSTHSGTLTVTVTSPTGKTVVIEGLAIYNP
jgi:streptogramin lyase